MSEDWIGRGRKFVLLASAAILMVSLVATLHAQGRYDREGPPPREYGGPPPPRSFELPTEATVQSKGYVFLDGEYISPPYEIRFADESVFINGHKLSCNSPPRSEAGRGFGPLRPGESPWRSTVSTLQRQLESDGMAMSFADQPMILQDTSTLCEMMKSLFTDEGRSMRQVSLMERLPADFDKQVWDDWIRGFEPPHELTARTAALIARFDENERKALAGIRARRLMETLTYPLTVGGMLMSVLAIGHLLGGRPHAGQPTFGVDASPAMIRALNWSLFFTAVFSSIDLVWTILAVNANAVQELNPLGSQLIENPRHLSGFKISVTFSCLALLWLLRRHKRAQIAAWWVCLVLTLITCRWLMVHSLYISA